jgi:hypothetical protein
MSPLVERLIPNRKSISQDKREGWHLHTSRIGVGGWFILFLRWARDSIAQGGNSMGWVRLDWGMVRHAALGRAPCDVFLSVFPLQYSDFLTSTIRQQLAK